MSDEVLIIGGGFAGLAAGVALAEAGRSVRVLEQRPHLGGRAYSFIDSRTGSIVDNGQHLIVGCYRQTIQFLKTIGTLDRVNFQSGMSIRFLDADGRASALDCPRLPSPWHLLLGVLRSDSFTWKEKFEVLGMRRAAASAKLSQNGRNRLTVDEWLEGLGQSERLRRNFWDLLCIAAMNEDPKVASAEMFDRVLKQALFSSPTDSRLGIPCAGLSDCYTTAAADFIRTRGGRVDVGRGVRDILVSNGVCEGVKLANGETIRANAVLSAAPWHKFVSLLPDSLLRSEPSFTNILSLKPAPIININLWFDRRITDLEFVALRGTTVQWLFHKKRSFSAQRHSASEGGPPYISLVLSGAHAHIRRSKEELLALALRDIQQLLPVARQANLVHSLIIKERFATFSPGVGIDEFRPRCATPVRGLYLAGDWTNTALPATIEGAVRSGYAAAETMLLNE